MLRLVVFNINEFYIFISHTFWIFIYCVIFCSSARRSMSVKRVQVLRWKLCEPNREMRRKIWLQRSFWRIQLHRYHYVSFFLFHFDWTVDVYLYFYLFFNQKKNKIKIKYPNSKDFSTVQFWFWFFDLFNLFQNRFSKVSQIKKKKNWKFKRKTNN